MKNVFHFSTKSLFVLKIFKFLSWMHTLANISKSKGNQTIKVGQLIECNIRKIFLEKSYIKCGWETSPKPFSEILKLIMNFEVKLMFLIKRFFLQDQQVRQRLKYLENKKSFWDEIRSIFQSNKQQKLFLEGESPTLNAEENFHFHFWKMIYKC